MRVVQLLPELNEGGVERGVVELNRELVSLGIESVVISAGGRQADQIDLDGGRHVVFDVVSKNLLTAPSRMIQLRKLLRQLNPDILHARSRVPAWLAFLANRSMCVPFVTTVHGFNSVNAYSRVMTFGDRVICVSRSIKEYVQKHYSVPEEKIVVIPRGVDLKLFNPDNIDREFMQDFKQKYQLDGRLIISSVGRITQLKDYETFIRGVVLAKEKLPTVVGLIVGGVRADKESYRQSLQALVAELGAEDYIHFAGNQAKIAEIYALSDLVISASRKPETFGRSVAEAIAMNSPVIATNHGGVLDIIVEGHTGDFFEVGDHEGLAGKIIDVCRCKTGSIRGHIEENFTLSTMVVKTIQVYESLLADRKN